MNKVKISTRLRVVMTLLLIISVAVMAFGVYGMYQLNESNKAMYAYNVKALDLLGDMRANVTSQRVLIGNAILYQVGTQQYKTAQSDLSTLEAQMDNLISQYKRTMTLDADKSHFTMFDGLYKNEFKASKTAVLEYTALSNPDQAFVELVKATSSINNMTDALMLSYRANSAEAQEASASNEALFERYSLLLIALVLFVILTTAIGGESLVKSITKPLRKMVEAANTIADGAMDVSLPQGSKDEVGQLARAFDKMAVRIKDQTETLSHIASGDLSVMPNISSDYDMIGTAMREVSDNLNRIVHDVRVVAGQVTTGAQQVSEGSHMLAQGSSEQASAIEQLSSSILEISLNTKENAKMAAQAAELYADMKLRAQEGAGLMDDMVRAVGEINEASVGISKIIKLINDISFQTNILALNAAVEAANAGQHGKGFAVVAGEVRNLAAKSSEAAKDTDALIENSLDKARLGVSLATQTSNALNEIVESVLYSAQLIDDIAKSSSEQSVGIEQVNVGIEQVAQVVNMNSNTAERSASAAEQMAAQAEAMERLVSNFRLREGDDASAKQSAPIAAKRATPAEPGSAPGAPERPVINLDDGFGKY